MSCPEYQWLSRAAIPPGRWDLRMIGWSLTHRARPEDLDAAPVVLDWRSDGRIKDWEVLTSRKEVVAVGVEDPATRSMLLSTGFGDALPMEIGLLELGARLFRLRGLADTLPRLRRAGPVVLDLLYRDGELAGQRLGLHPREFALLWRLAETAWRGVSRQELLTDVWRLDHVPETNTLEVHVSRLRAKLAVSGVDWLVETLPEGGYRLGLSPGTASLASPGTARQSERDAGQGGVIG